MITYVDGRRVGGLIPRRIEVPDTSRYVGANAVLGLEVGRILIYAIVDSVNRLDELAVELQPQGLDLCIGLRDLKTVGDNFFPKVSSGGTEVRRSLHMPRGGTR